MSITGELQQRYQSFVDRFERGKWTPTHDEWLQHAQVSRELLIATLAEVPGVSVERIEHAQRYIDPRKWSHADFLDRVYSICGSRDG